jgi:quinol monooxygenase YgiN
MDVPPEKTKEFLQTILLIVKSVRGEQGCLSCNFYQDMEDDSKFRLVGKWAT